MVHDIIIIIMASKIRLERDLGLHVMEHNGMVRMQIEIGLEREKERWVGIENASGA